MTLPTYLTGTVGYHNDPTVTDVQTIINSVTTLVTGLTPAWSNPGAGQLTSPADASGRQMTLVFSRVSATVLQLIATDGQGRSFTQQADIAVAGSSVDYYAGQYHLVLDWLNASSSEGFQLSLLDESPELQTSHNKWLVYYGSRNSAGSYRSLSKVGYIGYIDSTNSFSIGSRISLVPQGNPRNNNAGALANTKTQGGSNILYPYIAMGDSVAGVFKIRGKLYQQLICNGAVFGDGSEFTVPLDDSITGVFKVIHVAADTGNNDWSKLALRIS
jgi:hypothetical protein